jgi:hypothetical protein
MGMGGDVAGRKAALDKAVDELKLEGEAKEKVATIQKEYAAKFTELEASQKEADAKFREAGRESADREKLVQERNELRSKGATLMREYQSAVTGALTAEQ